MHRLLLNSLAAASLVAMLLVQSASADQIVTTRKGDMPLSQVQNELHTAGYPGPWATADMLVAYQRANPGATTNRSCMIGKAGRTSFIHVEASPFSCDEYLASMNRASMNVVGNALYYRADMSNDWWWQCEGTIRDGSFIDIVSIVNRSGIYDSDAARECEAMARAGYAVEWR